MAKTNVSDPQRDLKVKSMKLAELRMKDSIETKKCYDNLKLSGVDDETARVVTSAYREKILPNFARQVGLNASDISGLIKKSESVYDEDIDENEFRGRHPSDDNLENENDDFIPHDEDSNDDDEEYTKRMFNSRDDDMQTSEFAKKVDNKDLNEDLNKNLDKDRSKGFGKKRLDEDLDEDIDNETGDDDRGLNKDLNKNLNKDIDKGFGKKKLDKDLDEDLDNKLDKNLDEDGVDFEDEENESDEDNVTLEVTIPSNLLQKFEELIQSLSESSDDNAGHNDKDTELNDSEEENNSEDSESKDSDNSTQKRESSMNVNDRLAKLKAERDRIVKSSDDNHPNDRGLGDETNGTFMGERKKTIQHATGAQPKSEANHIKEIKYQGSNSNSQETKDASDVSPLEIPTLNPGNLNQSVMKGINMGGVEDSADYKINFDIMEVPSEDPDRDYPIEIPTEMSLGDRNTNEMTSAHIVSQSPDGTRLAEAIDMGKAEEILYHLLSGAGVGDKEISRLSYSEGIEVYHKLSQNNTSDERVAKVKIEHKVKENNLDFNPQASDENDGSELLTQAVARVQEIEKEAKINKARLSTAYGLTARLVTSGIISNDKMEENVKTWIDEGLTVPAMISHATQLLKLSSTSVDRIAGNNKENTRSASTNSGLTYNPIISGETSNKNNNISDLEQAVKEVMSNNKFAEYDKEVKERQNNGRRF